MVISVYIRYSKINQILLPIKTPQSKIRNLMLLNRTIESYHFGFSLNLTEPQLRTLTDLFQDPAPVGNSALEGRNAISPVQLDGIGSVVIKHYRRGGLMRHLIKRRYLMFGKTRARREFELLELVETFGINVPQPIVYAHRGRLFYRTWLVTRQIHQSMSLARLSLRDEKKAGLAMQSVIEQISALVQNHILHVDLHAGNVVVDKAGKVYLLDFDRGRVYHGNRQKLKNRYVARWQRAVAKHGLPKILTEMMHRGLQI
jgi:tRNA A-37 threonylcarbamoyl transferase component Bud32